MTVPTTPPDSQSGDHTLIRPQSARARAHRSPDTLANSAAEPSVSAPANRPALAPTNPATPGADHEPGAHGGRPVGKVVSFGAATLVLAALVAALLAHGNSSRSFTFRDDKAWLVNNDRGSVALVDGATGRPEFEMRFDGAAGDDLQVVQGPEGVFVLNRTTGEITRIDQAGMDTSGSIAANEADEPLLAIGGGKAYLVLKATGRVQQIDPDSPNLAPIGPPVELGGLVSVAVVDDRGRLAAAMPGAGRVRWVEEDRQIGDIEVGGAGGALRVSLVDRTVVAIDHTRATVAVVTPTQVERSFKLDLPTDGEIQLAEAMTGDRVWVLQMPSARLAGVRLTDGDTRTVELTFALGHPLGGPLPNGRFVYIPDLDQGTLLKVEADSGAFVDIVPVAADPVGRPPEGAGRTDRRFDAFVKDGKVWGNDPESDQAVVIDRDGNVDRVEKYRPGLPTNDPTDGIGIPPDTTPPVTPSIAPPTTTPPGKPAEPDPPIDRVPPSNPDRTLLDPGLGQITPPDSLPDAIPGTIPGDVTKPTTPPTDPGPNTPPPAAGLPTAPGGVSASAGDQRATVSWLPALDNGSPLLRYVVTSSAGTNLEIAAGTTTTVVTGLTNGTPITFRVRAVNAIGDGPDGSAAPVTPSAELPLAPVSIGVAMVAVPLGATDPDEVAPNVTWAAPTGGPAPTGYRVGCRTPSDPVGTVLPVVTGPTLQATVTGLPGGVAYRCFVAAVNADGNEGPRVETDTATLYSPYHRAIAVNMTSDLSVDSNDLSITWDPPADNGGSGIVWYEVCYTDQGASSEACFKTFGTQYTFSSLAFGDYSVRIHAVTGASQVVKIIGADRIVVITSTPLSTTTTGPPVTPP